MGVGKSLLLVKNEENGAENTTSSSQLLFETPSMGLNSFHEALVRERDKKQSFEEIYEILEDIGHGGLCQVYKIRKRFEKIGGSSRPDNISRRRFSLPRLPSVQSYPRLSQSQQSSFYNHSRTHSSSSTHLVTTEGSCSSSQLYYALKVINLKLVQGGVNQIDQLKNEVELLKTLDHRSIIKAYETFTSNKNKQLMIVMELCTGGDLYARMPHRQEQLVAIVIKQILSAMVYIHDRGIIHRDIKMENVVYESKHPEAAVKVIDFGLSKFYSQSSDSILKERVGTLYSMAPETMQGEYTAQADLWGVGVVAYIMLSNGVKPFEGKTPKQVVAKVLLGQYSFTDPAWDTISELAKDFIRKLLVVDPNERMTAARAIRHPWITNSVSNSSLDAQASMADEEFKQQVRENIVRYADYCAFRKLALNVIAKKSSSEEIFRLRKVFDEFDSENTGTITLAEFKKALAKLNYTEDELFEIFQKVDVNRNNVINYTEFLAAALATQGNIEEYRLAEAFDQIDSDDSGYISREDLRKILGDKSDDAYIDNLIASADVKRDGKISYDEFLQMFQEKRRDNVQKFYDEAESRTPQNTEEVLHRFGILRNLRRARDSSNSVSRSSSEEPSPARHSRVRSMDSIGAKPFLLRTLSIGSKSSSTSGPHTKSPGRPANKIPSSPSSSRSLNSKSTASSPSIAPLVVDPPPKVLVQRHPSDNASVSSAYSDCQVMSPEISIR